MLIDNGDGLHHPQDPKLVRRRGKCRPRKIHGQWELIMLVLFVICVDMTVMLPAMPVIIYQLLNLVIPRMFAE